MSERLGICTRYHQNESTYASLHVAERARETGANVSLLARHVCLKETSGHWDSLVMKERTPGDFFAWASDRSRILWTVPPPLAEVEWANDRGIDTWVLAVWDELIPSHREACAAASKLIMPYRCVMRDLTAKWGMTGNRLSMPWDVPVPFTFKDGLHTPPGINVLLPLCDSQAQRTDQDIFRVLRVILDECDNVSVTIATHSGWPISTRRAIKQLQREFHERIELAHRPRLLRRLMLYASHDLTLWPSKFEGLATTGLWSLCMGTPVLAWDISPANEYLKHEKNSVLVPCDIRENWLGVPEVIPDWQLFVDHAIDLLKNEQQLAKIRAHTSHGLGQRRQDFDVGWAKLWQ
jgi:hypothetical protein